MMVRSGRVAILLLLTVVSLLALGGLPVAAAAQPVKEIVQSRVGEEVNKSGANVCTSAEEKEGMCQPGKQSTQVGGFDYPHGVAVNNDPASAQHGDVYVIDTTHRVQVLGPEGQFVSVVGWDVNKTKVQKSGSSQQEMNICTAAEVKSGAECQPGATGAGPGRFNEVVSIAVDPANGDLFVAESIERTGFQGYGERIQEFTSQGEFVLEVGQGVNETTGANVCGATEELEGDRCGGPAEHLFEQASAPTKEHDAFSFAGSTVLAAGGPNGLLYVGERGRVQELRPDGRYEREIPLQFISSLSESNANHIAVNAQGEVYLTYYELYEEAGGQLKQKEEHASIVYGFNPTGQLALQLVPSPHDGEGARVELEGLAFDPSGRLAVLEVETEKKYTHGLLGARGTLYDIGTGNLHLVSEFEDMGVGAGEGFNALAFSNAGDMYASKSSAGHEVVIYKPVTIGELTTGPATCVTGPDRVTDATLECKFHGTVNPDGVPDTAVWFQWGFTTALTGETTKLIICGETCGTTPVNVESAPIQGLTPNAVIHYRLAGQDAVVQPPEVFAGETLAFKLPAVPPRIVGVPVAQFVRPTAVDLYGNVNPENTPSEYFFEYASGGRTLADRCPQGVRKEECAGVHSTGTLGSAVYGKTGATLETSGLQPGTPYRFRLMAINESGQTALNEGGGTSLPEGEFQTPQTPSPRAVTGAPGTVGATSATVSGTVDPSGQPAVYGFELGVYQGAGTQYYTVFTASVTGTASTEETTNLSNLQPGTTYAYRIMISNAYGTMYGMPVVFTTSGLAEALKPPGVLSVLPMPKNVHFPKEGPKHQAIRAIQKLKKTLRACRKDKRKHRRVSCERRARERFAKHKRFKK